MVKKHKKELEKYYNQGSKTQEYHCLDLFCKKGLAGMYEYREHIRLEENCDMVNRLTDNCCSLEFFSCPGLSQVINNDAGVCPEYSSHCTGRILPIMTQAGFYAGYNLIDCKKTRCKMLICVDKEKAARKKSELARQYDSDIILCNF